MMRNLSSTTVGILFLSWMSGAVVSAQQQNFVAAGTDHSVARREDGTVWAWGDNEFGQLGDGTVTDRPNPVQVILADGDPLAEVQLVASRGWHTLAVNADNRVLMWGLNDEGQLGDGTFVSSHHPVAVIRDGGALLGGVVEVACGEKHTVALRSDGTVWAWGNGNDGQVGDGEAQDTPFAVRVIDQGGTILFGFQAVAAGRFHSLALKDDGTVWAWGSNSSGQIGAVDELPVYDVATPVVLEDGTPLSGVRAITAGRFYSLAITEAGTLLAWGRNDFGQFGDGSTDDSFRARQFIPQDLDPSLVTQLVAGAEHTLALASGDLWTWGSNDFSQLGRPQTDPFRSPDPIPVIDAAGLPLVGIADTAAGKYFSLALVGASGQILSWGDDDQGQLGQAQTRGSEHLPAPVVFADGEPFLVTGAGDPSQASGALAAPSGTVSGLVTVEADAQDPDGLDRVYVTFISEGPQLVLCGTGAEELCVGTMDSYSQEGVDPLDFGASFGPLTMELFVRDANAETLKVAERSFTLESDASDEEFVLTVIKQGGGTGTLTSTPTGVVCDSSCPSANAPFPANTEILLSGVADGDSEFLGFAGERCFGRDPCMVILNRNLTVRATFGSEADFQPSGSSPSEGNTNVATNTNVSIDFNRDIATGPEIAGIVFREVGGADIPFEIIFPSQPDRLIVYSLATLQEGTAYQVVLPAGAIQDTAGEPLPSAFELTFTTAVFGQPKIYVSALPRNVIEGEQFPVHVWFDRSQPFSREIILDSGGRLSHPPSVTIAADEVVREILVTALPTSADVIAALQVIEAESGTTGVNIMIGDSDPVIGTQYQFVSAEMVDDDNHNGVFETNEDAEFRVTVRNIGSSGVSNPQIHVSIVDAPGSLIRPVSDMEFIAFLTPGEVDDATVELRAFDEFLTGEYLLRIEGTSDVNSFVAYHSFEVVNELPVDLEFFRGSEVNPRHLDTNEVYSLEYFARNIGDGVDPTLPEVVFSLVSSSGETVFERRTFADVRDAFSDEQTFDLSLATPSVPGTYTLHGIINPPPDRIPESSYDNNEAATITLIVELPNRPPIIDPPAAPFTVNACETLEIVVTAVDLDDDPLEFTLLQAPSGAVLESIDSGSARLAWTPTASQGPAASLFEIQVEDDRNGSDRASFTVNVTRIEDLSIVQMTPSTTAVPGGAVSFNLAVSHQGSCGVSVASLVDLFDTRLENVTWNCTASSGSSCSPEGVGNLEDLALNLADGGTASYEVAATVTTDADGAIENCAIVTILPPVTDPVSSNDSDCVALTLLDVDFGDAPDAGLGSLWSYPTRRSDDGARHGIAGPRLGAVVDGETDGLPTLQATGDDQEDSPDEDGIAFLSPLFRCADAELEVSITAGGRLDGWIDWNVNGTWELEEKILDGVDLSAGVHALPINVPCEALADRWTFARFRVSTAGSPEPTGLALDGEVEDHRVWITPKADLSVEVTNGFEVLVTGQSVSYTVIVANAGLDSVLGAEVVAAVPVGLGTVSWTCLPSAGSTCQSSGEGAVSDAVDILAGGSLTYQIDGIVVAGSNVLSFTSSVIPPMGTEDPDESNNMSTDTDPVTATADLWVTMTNDRDSVVAGQQVTYTLTVGNSGPSGVSGAQVLAPIPAGFDEEFGVTWACTPSGNAQCTANGSGDLADIVILPVGGSVIYQIEGTLLPDFDALLSFTGSVLPPLGVEDPDESNNMSTDSDPVTAIADLWVTITNGLGSLVAGQQVTYTLTLGNSGPSGVIGAQVLASIPVGFDEELGVEWTCTPSVDVVCELSGSGDLADIITLPVGGTAIYEVEGTLLEEFDAVLAFTGSVASPQGTDDPDTSNNTSTDSDQVHGTATVFSDGFESGDTSAWASLLGSVRLLRAPAYMPDEYWAQLHLDAKSMTGMSVGSKGVLLLGLGPGSLRIFSLEIRRMESGLEVGAFARCEGCEPHPTWRSIVGPGFTAEVEWRQSLDSARDGQLLVSVDGVLTHWLTELDNDAWDLESIVIPTPAVLLPNPVGRGE